MVKWRFRERLSNIFERKLPHFMVSSARDALAYSGVEMRVGEWLLFSMMNSLLLGVLISLFVDNALGVSGIGIMLFGTAVFGGVIYGILHNVLIYYGTRRAVQIDAMLPDALQLISANIRADIPIHKSLMLAARPEFGLLAKELDMLGKEILSGKATDVAFKGFSERINSPLVSRITTLMEEGLRSGHDLASMMEQVAYDIRAFRILDDEAKANISSYVMFIMMAVLVIAPVLYSISISFIDLSDQVKETLDVGSLVSDAAIGSSSPLVGLVGGDRGVDAETLIWFAAINLAVSAGIAGILISVLKTGEAMQNLPQIPVFIIIAEVIFFVTITVMRTVLGGLFV